jgi:hypothetical protein
VHEQVGEGGPIVQDLDRKRCQELGVPSLCHHEGFAGRCQPSGQTGSKKTIGDTDLAATCPGAGSHWPGTAGSCPLAIPGRSGTARNYSFDRCRNFGCQRQVASEIAGRPACAEGQLAGMEHFDPRGERFDRRHGWLPLASLGGEISQ